MHRTRRWTGVLSLTALAGAALAPAGGGAQSSQPLPPLDEYQIRAFGVADGLPAANVWELAQGSDGYLYVANTRGLARYDGYGFRGVPLPGFRSQRIDWLRKDRAGRLWLHTAENELGYVEDGRVRALPPAPGPLLGFSATADGAVWCGQHRGLVRVTPGAAAPYAVFGAADGLPDDTAYGAFDLPDGRRVVVTDHHLLRVDADRSRPGGLRFVPLDSGFHNPSQLRADGSGLWLAFHDHVMRYDGTRFTRFGAGGPPLPFPALDWGGTPAGAEVADNFTRHVRSVGAGPDGALGAAMLSAALRARDGTHWLVLRDSADGGFELARLRDGRAQPVPLRQLRDFQRIQHLVEDHEGSLWVGTDLGLFQLAPRRVFALTRGHGLAEGFTAPIVQTRDGAVWVGTWQGGLHRFADGRLARRYAVADGLPDDHVRALHEAADGTLWVGTYLGYAAIRGGRVVTSERTGEEVHAFAETRGTLWVALTNRLLALTDRGVRPHRPDHWRGRAIWALHAARDGALWVGTEHGLFRLAGDSLRAFGEADGLRSQFVASIHEEADGTLWFGTYAHGLHRYRGGRFAAVTTREGLHHDGVWQMLEDGRGGVWMSSDQGVFRVGHAELHAVADAVERGAPPARLSPLVFTEREGLPDRESNRASPGGWRLSDGRLLFNNVSGVVVIDPVRAAAPAPPPRVVLHGPAADGRAAPLPDDGARPARLPAGTRQIAFDFAALSFVAPEQNRYRYRLDGYDSGWVSGGTQHRASYTNLPPGHYTFRVQGAAGAGAWRDPGAAVQFAVAPALWQTWWLRLVAAVALAVLLAAAYRARVNRLLELERLRLRIAADLHDDVGSSLSSIALLSEMLRGHARLDDLERRQLQRIHSAAEETIGALRDVIWLVDPKHDDLDDLLAKLRGVAGDLLNGTAHTFEAAASARRANGAPPLGMTCMRNVLLIYKEALHNVVKHARASRVRIAVAEERGALVLRIEDDGVGFDEAAVRPGHGLGNMRLRARQAGGSLAVESAPGRGTRITLAVRMA